MHDHLKIAFESLTNHPEFQELIKEYRFRFGIPESGFADASSDNYKNWIREAQRKPDVLKDQFMFIAKRCQNLVRGKDSIPYVLLAYYFIFGKDPKESSPQNDFIFSISPSGFLGSFDVTFTVPFNFEAKQLFEEIKKYEDQIRQLASNTKEAVAALNNKGVSKTDGFDSKLDLMATTPGNGADLVDKLHRDIAYLAEFGRVVLRGHLQSMKEEEFEIQTYDDKNKPMYQPIQQMGRFLLSRQLYPIVEEYWRQIDEEIRDFNQSTGKKVNRGIPLANTGVAQIAQGKTIEGLFNIYKGYEDDRVCLQHLPNINIDPERDMASSVLFTQFEGRQIKRLFHAIVVRFQSVFLVQLSEKDLSDFILGLRSDKKLLFYMILYRFSFAQLLDSELTTVISRSEIIRSLAEIALWYEDELKRKDPTLSGRTLVQILDQKVGQLNPAGSSGLYTSARDLTELSTKISNIKNTQGGLELTNSRVLGCLRNFAGHNLDVQNHPFFQISDEVFARILSFMIFSKNQGWI